MTKLKKKLARERKRERMLNAIGHFAMWREMNCPVRILGVADPTGLKEGQVIYQGLKEDVENCGTPIIPNVNVLKSKYVYIVELPEHIEVETPDGEHKKAKALFLAKRDLSSPIHPDKIKEISKENLKKTPEEG
jgi:hypothetical protein